VGCVDAILTSQAVPGVPEPPPVLVVHLIEWKGVKGPFRATEPMDVFWQSNGVNATRVTLDAQTTPARDLVGAPSPYDVG
jgi:hypothetical protein